jgi:hypothetical protein
MSLVVRNLIQSLEEIDRLKYNILGYVTDLQRANEQIAQLRAEVAEYREALEYMGRACLRESTSECCTCIPHKVLAKYSAVTELDPAEKDKK